MKKMASLALLLTSTLCADFPQTPVTPYGTGLVTGAEDQKVQGAKVVYDYVTTHNLGVYLTPDGKVLVFQSDTPTSVVAIAANNLRSQQNASSGTPGYSLSPDQTQIIGRDQAGVAFQIIAAINSLGLPDTETIRALLGQLQAATK